jgi:hypothetical protein
MKVFSDPPVEHYNIRHYNGDVQVEKVPGGVAQGIHLRMYSAGTKPEKFGDDGEQIDVE